MASRISDPVFHFVIGTQNIEIGFLRHEKVSAADRYTAVVHCVRRLTSARLDRQTLAHCQMNKIECLRIGEKRAIVRGQYFRPFIPEPKYIVALIERDSKSVFRQ